MNDTSLLNELELKIKDLVRTLKVEREKNMASDKLIQESSKLSKIEEEVKNLLEIVNQIDI
jgi:archaellum component FlaC